MALADTVAAEHGDALAVPEFEIERIGQSGDLELLADDRPLAGPGAAELDVDLLHRHVGRTLVLLDEVSELRLGRLQLGRERLADRRPLTHQLDVVLEPLLLGVVQRLVVLAEGIVVLLRLGVRGERTAVRPGAGGVEGDDLGRGRREQFAVVADEDDGLARLVQLLFEPALGRDVEEVVGLVEHEDLELAAEQRLEGKSLLFAAAECSQWPVGDVVERFIECSRRAFVPQHLGVVPADVAPRRDRVGVRHRVVVEPFGCPVESGGSVSDPCRRDRQQQLAHRGRRMIGGARPAGASRRDRRRC